MMTSRTYNMHFLNYYNFNNLNIKRMLGKLILYKYLDFFQKIIKFNKKTIIYGKYLFKPLKM